MERETFYKDQYDQTLEIKNEINNSPSIQAGILTALIAGLFFIASSFSYNSNKLLAISFSAIGILSIYSLGRSVYYLINAFSDFRRGYTYAYINDADTLDIYFQNLVEFYTTEPGLPHHQAIEISEKEFAKYVTKKLIENATVNQKTNGYKSFQRFLCDKFITYSLISLSLLLIPYGIDFGITKVQNHPHKEIRLENLISTSRSIK